MSWDKFISARDAASIKLYSMWDEDDTFGRWVQGLCAIPLVLTGTAVEYYDWTHLSSNSMRYATGAVGIGCIILGLRCAGYAITGRNNVNRDDY